VARILYAADRLWRADDDSVCSFDPNDLQAEGRCEHANLREIFGAHGGRIIAKDIDLVGFLEIDVDARTQRVLSPNDPVRYAVLQGDFVTGVFYDPARIEPDNVGRFPVTEVAEPTMLLAPAVASAVTRDPPAQGIGPLAVTSHAVYFAQMFDDDSGPGLSRYIFRRPLPE
jgi:hypothetical protein